MTRVIEDVKLGFDDISLVPEVVSSITSRNDDIDTSILMGNIKIEVPLIASPMKDVCNGEFAVKLTKLGCFGVVHRFCPIVEQILEFGQNKHLSAAVGINGDCVDRFKALYAVGCRVFCIDVANGANLAVKTAIDRFLDLGEAQFIVGNVASCKTFEWAAKLPRVIGVRVGIAGGSACTTKNATGIYSPMASLLMDCKLIKDANDIDSLIIADGGIREPADFCKAIALGADCAMMGSVFAVANDSPAELIKRDGRFFKVYHGSASFEIQKTYKEIPKYIEGKTRLLDFENESVEQIVARFSDGLKSSMSYFNSRTINEFQKNAIIAIKHSPKFQ